MFLVLGNIALPTINIRFHLSCWCVIKFELHGNKIGIQNLIKYLSQALMVI